jgi:hypothetical protein
MSGCDWVPFTPHPHTCDQSKVKTCSGKGKCIFPHVSSSIVYNLGLLNNTYGEHLFPFFMNKRSYSSNWYQNFHHFYRTTQKVLPFLMLFDPFWIPDTYVLIQDSPWKGVFNFVVIIKEFRLPYSHIYQRISRWSSQSPRVKSKVPHMKRHVP